MNNSFKIVHIISGLSIGGAETMLKRLLISDSASKENAVVISLTDLGKIGLDLRAQGFAVHFLNMGRLSSFPKSFWQLMMLLRKYKPQVVQTWMYHADLLGGIAAYLTGNRNVVWGIRRTLAPLRQTRIYLIMKVCAMFSYFLPKKIICVAEAAKNSHSRYGYQASKIQVISNGLDFSKFDLSQINGNKIRTELSLTNNELLVGCIGRFHFDKGQDIFIKAVSLLDTTVKLKTRFLLIGRNCDYYNQELVHQIDAYVLSENFILLGEREDIPDCLAAIDIFCMPSRSEGFPNGLGEAMAMEKPCVATLVGDTGTFVENTGILVPPNDAKALAEALSKLINMELEERIKLGKQASKRVRNTYSIEHARERFYAVYREILELPN